MKDWFYFGCNRDTGHYLHDRHRYRVSASHGLAHRLNKFDGSLPPLGQGLYVASVTHLGGLGMTALAWWDQSVDTRPGSNSIIFAPVESIQGEDLLHYAEKMMPWVFARLPRPLVLMGAA